MFRLPLWRVFVYIVMTYMTASAVAAAEQEKRDREAALEKYRQETLVPPTKTKFNTGGSPGPVITYRRRTAP